MTKYKFTRNPIDILFQIACQVNTLDTHKHTHRHRTPVSDAALLLTDMHPLAASTTCSKSTRGVRFR